MSYPSSSDLSYLSVYSCRNRFLLQSNYKDMALDNVITSPHRRSQTQTAFSPPSPRKQHSKGEELGNFSTLVQRHRFLLTALALLVVLCTIYLYFAVTLGAANDAACSDLVGSQKASCLLQMSKSSLSAGKGKLKFL